MSGAKVVVEFSSHCTGNSNKDFRRISKLSQEPLSVLALCCTTTSVLWTALLTASFLATQRYEVSSDLQVAHRDEPELRNTVPLFTILLVLGETAHRSYTNTVDIGHKALSPVGVTLRIAPGHT